MVRQILSVFLFIILGFNIASAGDKDTLSDWCSFTEKCSRRYVERTQLDSKLRQVGNLSKGEAGALVERLGMVDAELRPCHPNIFKLLTDCSTKEAEEISRCCGHNFLPRIKAILEKAMIDK